MNLNVDKLENALVICPNNYKDKILEIFNNEKKIVNASFMSIEEFKKNLCFDYDIDAIKYLCEQGFSVENSKEILENINYIEDKEYNNTKLNRLVQYKKQLDDNKLLIYNPIFKNYICNKKIIVCGYCELDSVKKALFKGLNVEILYKEEVNIKYKISKFSTIEEEVEYLYNSIYDLLEKGTDINNIYIFNANEDYKAYFKRFNSYYGFNVDCSDNSYIYGTKLASIFIEMLENNSKQEIYDFLIQYSDKVAHKLINILNKYVRYELRDVKELIIYDLKNSKLSDDFRNVVRCIDYLSPIKESDYVFFVGLNDQFPTTKKDTDYITDNIKSLVNLQTSEEINELNKKNIKRHLSNIKNIAFSFCESTPFKVFNKQVLFDNVEYINNKESLSYNHDLNKYKLIDKFDKLRKYNSFSDDLSLLYKKYNKNNYLNYNNRFSKLTNEQITDLATQINNDEKLTLSYSSMNEFYECGFKYYLKHVLKLNNNIGTYYTKIGTVCHGVLKDLYTQENFEFEKSWNEQVKIEEDRENEKIFENEYEKYFVERLKEELKKDIEVVKKQKANSELNKEICENEFVHDVTNKIRFKGFVDKIMYKETEDQIFANVIDYKTGKTIEIDKDIMKYGLSLQLPSYLYLMNHSKYFNKDIRYIGLYIQHLINYDRNYNENNSISDIKEESMKLYGISSDDLDRIIAADLSLPSSKNSKSIKGISLNKDGSLRSSNNIYTDKEFEELDNIVENSIINAGNSILSGDFDINPKQIDGKNKSCLYCNFSPICYKRIGDIKCISTKEEQ